MVHGDDFVTVGDRQDTKWMEEELKKRFEIKTKVIGDGSDESREESVLNRIIRRTPEGWEYEADQRHADILIKAMNMEDGKEVSTAGEDDKPWKEQEENVPLPKEQETEYRALAARANYLANDRVDIQYAVKEICRGMAKPMVRHKRMLKRLARYLVGKPRLVSKFPMQDAGNELWGYSDSDWAGCKKTAKSTSGGIIMKGGHMIKSWSSTQKSITLSSGEAELVAAVKLCTEVLGITQLAADWGIKMEGKLFVDSNAAIGVVHRKGNGKLRHVKVGSLWIQERVEEKEVEVRKVRGESNPADLLTKNVNQEKVERFCGLTNQERVTGRADKGLRIAEDVRKERTG